uniref:SPARC (osteonectin), cwcv and kazal like domains proteoglycan 3 n=1 Tax=Junco hyemalis TaxID=40217 RepID=A0A8C5J828_JUNHY
GARRGAGRARGVARGGRRARRGSGADGRAAADGGACGEGAGAGPPFRPRRGARGARQGDGLGCLPLPSPSPGAPLAGGRGAPPRAAVPCPAGSPRPGRAPPWVTPLPVFPLAQMLTAAAALVCVCAAAWCNPAAAAAAGGRPDSGNFLDDKQWLTTVSQYDKEVGQWNKFRDVVCASQAILGSIQ